MEATIPELVEQIHANAVAKGFWEGEKNFAEQIMLVVTELAECVEAHRSGKNADKDDISKSLMNMALLPLEESFDGGNTFALRVKDTVEDELADAMIRIMDMCGGHGIDIESHIILKIHYNSTRERLHGKKY